MASGLFAALVIVGVEVLLVKRWISFHSYISEPWHWFLFTDVEALAFALLLVSVAVLSSLLWKKQVAALMTTLVLFGVVVLGITITYPTLLSPTTIISGEGSHILLPQGSLIVSQSSVTKTGVKLSSTYTNQVLSTCTRQARGKFNGTQSNSGNLGPLPTSTFNPSTYTSCLESHDLYTLISYQLPFRFWELQWIYTGMTLGATAAIVALSFMFVNRIEI
jgi:hypothetical protein